MLRWVGKVRVQHHHMCGSHQSFSNEYIVGKTFEDLKCLNKSLGLFPCCINQLHRPNRRCSSATPCCESWGSLGAFVRGEIQACKESVSLYDLEWNHMQLGRTCKFVHIPRHEIVISSRIKLCFHKYSSSTGVLCLKLDDRPVA